MEQNFLSSQTIRDLDIIKSYEDELSKGGNLHYELRSYTRNGKTFERKELISNNLPIYNTPISASKEFEKIKEKKQKISEDGYSDEDVTRFINSVCTDEFLAKLKKQLNHNSVLLPMPSTSGKNKIPQKLSEKIGQKLGIKVIPGSVIGVQHTHEAKKLRGVDKLIYNRKYIIENNGVLDKFKHNDIYIIDDLFSTGQSVSNLAQLLDKEKFHVPNIISISKASSSFVSVSDINKMVELAHQNLGIDKSLAEKKLSVLSKESSTIGYQMYQDLQAKNKVTQDKYKNWFQDGK